MFNQFSNIRSKICNTDNHGLRFNHSLNLEKMTQYLINITIKKMVQLLLAIHFLLVKVNRVMKKLFPLYYPAKLNIIFITLAEGDFQVFRK